MKVDKDLVVPGNFQCGSFTPPADSVGNDAINPADPVDCDNQLHQYKIPHAQKTGTAVVAERVAKHVAESSGSLFRFRAGLTTALVGADTITIDLLKNNASILSAPIILTSTLVAYATRESTFLTSPSNYVADDVFEFNITISHTSGTMGQGLFVELMVREQP